MNKQIETAPERIVLCPLIEGTMPPMLALACEALAARAELSRIT